MKPHDWQLKPARDWAVAIVQTLAPNDVSIKYSFLRCFPHPELKMKDYFKYFSRSLSLRPHPHFDITLRLIAFILGL